MLVTQDAHRSGDDDLAEYFRRRALVTGALAGLTALVGVFVLRADAPNLFDRLLSARGIPILAASALAGLASMWLLRTLGGVIWRGYPWPKCRPSHR